MKSLRGLGLVASTVALVALLGVGAAQGSTFHTEEAPASIFGSQVETHEITIEGASVSCGSADLSGTAETQTFSDMELSPEYSECTAFGFAGAHVTTNGCMFKIHPDGTLDIVCPNGEVTTITVSSIFNTKCHVDIPAQAGVTNVSVDSLKDAVLALLMVITNLQYTVTESTGLCPLDRDGEGSDGEYVGTSELTANGGEMDFWWTE